MVSPECSNLSCISLFVYLYPKKCINIAIFSKTTTFLELHRSVRKEKIHSSSKIEIFEMLLNGTWVVLLENIRNVFNTAQFWGSTKTFVISPSRVVLYYFVKNSKNERYAKIVIRALKWIFNAVFMDFCKFLRNNSALDHSFKTRMELEKNWCASSPWPYCWHSSLFPNGNLYFRL